MEIFKEKYNSLTEKLGDNVNLSAVLEFITYFRSDDIDLYRDFLEGYKKVGSYDTKKLIELYCKSNNIVLNDENAEKIFMGLVDNIWNNNMSYHLTTSVSALNIYENGMDPSKKEMEVVEDIESLANVLSETGKRNFLPFVRTDIKKYSYSSIPRLNVNYGKYPEWYLNLVGYNTGSLDSIMNYVRPMIELESFDAQFKLIDIIYKYYDLYKNSVRTLVVIPGLNKQLSKEQLVSFKVESVSILNENIRRFLDIRSSNINAKSNKCVSSSELMFISTSTKKNIDFESENKKM